MSYNYQTEKPGLLAPDNIPKLMKARDKILAIVKEAGAISGGAAMCQWPGGGDSWQMMAVADWMVENGDLREVEQRREPAGQHRVYMEPYSR